MSKRDRILMCPPDHFTVEYAINPWMGGNEGQLDSDLARRQWDKLVAAISAHADVVTIDPQPDLPDMVFTANAGVVYGNKAIASHFMPHERRPEEAHFKRWFRENGFELFELDEKLGFEGAGDCFRTEIEAHPAIAGYLGRELVSIKLTDERFYHIDTCFCPLTDGFLMYHPPAFDFESRMKIESRVPPHKRIICDTLDAGNFACNAVNVGLEVFVHRMSEPLKARLMLAGFRVHEIDLSEFLKSGGSAKCLTLKLTEPVTH